MQFKDGAAEEGSRGDRRNKSVKIVRAMQKLYRNLSHAVLHTPFTLCHT